MSKEEEHLDKILEAVDILTEILILRRKGGDESDSREEKMSRDRNSEGKRDFNDSARMDVAIDYSQLLKESDMNQFQRMKSHSFRPVSGIFPHLDDALCETKEMLVEQIAACNHIMSYFLDPEEHTIADKTQKEMSYIRFHRDTEPHENIIKMAGIRASELFSLDTSESALGSGRILKGFYFSDPFDSVLKPYLRIRTIDKLKKGYVHLPVEFLQPGDVLHMPFTSTECHILDTFVTENGVSRESFIQASRYLPGRTGSDCFRFYQDLQLFKQHEGKRIAFPDKAIYYQSSRKVVHSKLFPLLCQRRMGKITRSSFSDQYRRNVASSIRATSAACDPLGSVNDVHFHPSKDIRQMCVVSMGTPNEAILYNFKAGHPAEKKLLSGHTDGVLDSRYSVSGEYLVTASLDKTIKIWDSSSGAMRKSLENHVKKVTRISMNPDSSSLSFASIGDDDQLFYWKYIVESDAVESHAIPKNLTSYKREEIIIGNSVALGTLYSLDGKNPDIEDSSCSSIIELWNLERMARTIQIKSINTIDIMELSPDEKTLAYAIKGRNTLFDCRTSKMALSLKTLEAETASMAFHQNNIYIAQGMYDCSLLVSDIRKNSGPLFVAHHEKVSLSPISSGVSGLCWWPDSNLLVTAAEDGLIQVWDTNRNGEAILPPGSQRPSGSLSCLAVNPSGDMIASGENTGRVLLYTVPDSPYQLGDLPI